MPRVYGTPWSKLVQRPITLDKKVLERLGEALVEAVVREARKDFAKQGKAPRRGEPEGLPDSEGFFQSFKYRVVGNSTVEVYSTWPYINQIVEGRRPYPMSWLTRQHGVETVPLLNEAGQVIFRAAPLTTKDAWIHPGFARHTFFQRGIRKGREEMARIVSEEAMKVLSKGDPLR